MMGSILQGKALDAPMYGMARLKAIEGSLDHRRGGWSVPQHYELAPHADQGERRVLEITATFSGPSRVARAAFLPSSGQTPDREAWARTAAP